LASASAPTAIPKKVTGIEPRLLFITESSDSCDALRGSGCARSMSYFKSARLIGERCKSSANGVIVSMCGRRILAAFSGRGIR
jgi:hypothetical protein